jgi:hypothetical protein
VVGSGQFGIRRAGLFCLLGDRLNGGRAVDGLLGAGDVGQPGSFSLANDDLISRARHLGGGTKEMAGLVFSCRQRGSSYCCFAQLNMLAGGTSDEERKIWRINGGGDEGEEEQGR